MGSVTNNWLDKSYINWLMLFIQIAGRHCKVTKEWFKHRDLFMRTVIHTALFTFENKTNDLYLQIQQLVRRFVTGLDAEWLSGRKKTSNHGRSIS